MNKSKTRSIITMILVLTFSFMCVVNKITSDQFVPIFASIITFYFTSSEKEVKNNDN